MSRIPCRECQRQIPAKALTCPHCGVIAPVLQHATTEPDETPVQSRGHEAQDKPVAALPEGGVPHRPTRQSRPRERADRQGRRRRRPHSLVYAICGLALMIVIVASLTPHIGSLAKYYIGSLGQFISALAQYGKSPEPRREGTKTAADAKAESELKESESWAKAACQAAAASRLNASLTASFVYDDVARIEGQKAYVIGSLDVPNGFWTKVRHQYSCELAPRGQGRWSVTKLVFGSS